ncbi:alpha/beta hydrolase [Meridianimarinicoccus sp. RP-17]|uniref:alpha/beta hydrolase n=1 Tax=Meridianimarinicoccus zhengii TaxID=2056810 RepID=UPI000DADD90C|nr:alpha/beta hydrolase [Phycocomes zhengii]
MTQTQAEEPHLTRMPPGAAGTGDIAVHQGWALTRHGAVAGPARDVDIVLLHGMSAGAWIWPEDWISGFTSDGYAVWTMTLPGRDGGGSISRDPGVIDRALAHAMETGDSEGALRMLVRALPGASLVDGPDLGDFADALARALAQVGRPAVVVGHSLGGAVAQLLLRRGMAPAGTVLLASVPPYGTWRASAELALTAPHVWRMLGRFALEGPAAADMDLMRQVFFPGGVRDRTFLALVANLRDESLAALVQASGWPPFAPLPGPREDVLVIGGGRDVVVPPTDTWLTAGYYGTRPVILPGAGHMLMHDAEAAQAGAAIRDWCAARATSAAA